MESVVEIVAAMNAAAEQGEWGRVGEFSEQLRVVIADIPTAEQRAMRQLHDKAESARHEVTDKLSEIRRGRDAAKAYGNSY